MADMAYIRETLKQMRETVLGKEMRPLICEAVEKIYEIALMAPKDADEIICNDGESVESKLVKIVKAIGDVESDVTNNIMSEIGKIGQAVKQLEAGQSNLSGDIADVTNSMRALDESQKAIQLMLAGKIDGAYLEDGYLYLTSGNEVIEGPLGATFNYGISQIPELLKREKGTTICCLQTANDYIPNFEDEV